MKTSIVAAAVLLASVSFSTLALADMVSGEVKKINTDTQKITLKHEPIANLDMGAMTMVFKAANPEMLTTVAPGDKVMFEADRVNGQITVTSIEKAN